jgi:NAD(P)-dependent dehydrogenase (short-subunit alcohol dehydrogenase family)
MPLNPRMTDWQGRVAWLVGASTGIGRATAELLHARGARVVVSARDAGRLNALTVAQSGMEAIALDATDAPALHAAVGQIVQRHGGLDLVMYCAGHYKAMTAQSFDLAEALRHQSINYVGALNLLDAVLAPLQRQAAAGRAAHLSLVASVAGYRGLPQSLAYGPTKAALINLAETLYMDLAPCGVGVSVINPGFVETPMTAGNRFPMPALMTPADAAEAILAGWRAGDFEIHFPRRFTLALKALRPLADGLYFRAVRRATAHRPRSRHDDRRTPCRCAGGPRDPPVRNPDPRRCRPAGRVLRARRQLQGPAQRGARRAGDHPHLQPHVRCAGEPALRDPRGGG